MAYKPDPEGMGTGTHALIKRIPWFYQTYPNPPPPPRFEPGSSSWTSPAVPLECKLNGIQAELRRMHAQEDEDMESESLSGFLGGNHNVEEMIEEARLAEITLKRPQGDDCTLRSAGLKAKHLCKDMLLSNDALLQFGRKQLQGFQLQPALPGIPLFPQERKLWTVKKEDTLTTEVKSKRGRKRKASLDQEEKVNKGFVTNPYPVSYLMQLKGLTVPPSTAASGLPVKRGRGRPPKYGGAKKLGIRTHVEKSVPGIEASRGLEQLAEIKGPTSASAPTTNKAPLESRIGTDGPPPPSEIVTESPPPPPPTEIVTEATPPPTEIVTEATPPPSEIVTESPPPPPPTEIVTEGPHPPTEIVTEPEGPHLPTEIVTEPEGPNPPIEIVTEPEGPPPPTEIVTEPEGPHPRTEIVTEPEGPNPPIEIVTEPEGPPPPTDIVTEGPPLDIVGHIDTNITPPVVRKPIILKIKLPPRPTKEVVPPIKIQKTSHLWVRIRLDALRSVPRSVRKALKSAHKAAQPTKVPSAETKRKPESARVPPLRINLSLLRSVSQPNSQKETTPRKQKELSNLSQDSRESPLKRTPPPLIPKPVHSTCTTPESPLKRTPPPPLIPKPVHSTSTTPTQSPLPKPPPLHYGPTQLLHSSTKETRQECATTVVQMAQQPPRLVSRNLITAFSNAASDSGSTSVSGGHVADN